MLAVGLLLSQGAPYNVLAQSPFELNPVYHAEEILKSLSSEQRKALEQLDTNSNFTISPDINTNSPELVKVIVEFEQAPAALGISVGPSDVFMSIPTLNGSASIERFENMQLLGKDFSDRLEDLQGQTLPIILQDLVKQLILLGKISTEDLR